MISQKSLFKTKQMKKGLFLLLCMVSLCTASVSYCRADASPPTKESSTKLTATAQFAEVPYAPINFVKQFSDFLPIVPDAKTVSVKGVWDTPTKQNSYAIVGRVPYLSWQVIPTNTIYNNETRYIIQHRAKPVRLSSICRVQPPSIYMVLPNAEFENE